MIGLCLLSNAQHRSDLYSHSHKVQKNGSLNHPQIDKPGSWGFFGRARQGNDTISGGSLHLNETQSFTFKVALEVRGAYKQVF